MKEIEELDSIVKSLLETEEEKITWMARPAVSFQGIEVFLGDRVAAIPLSSLVANMKNGAMDLFARKLLFDLRNKRFISRCNECGLPKTTYRRKDVIREINWALKEVVTGASRFSKNIPSEVKECSLENQEITEFLRSLIHKFARKELLMDKPIDQAITIQKRSLTLLLENGINNLRELTRKTEDELSKIDGLGPIGVSQIRTELEKLNLEFRRSESMTRSAG